MKNIKELLEHKKPLQVVKEFFKNYVETYKIIEERKRLENLRKKFVEDFPIETLKDLTLEDYCIGRNKEGFCYRLEYELVELCEYSGPRNRFGIYYNQKKKKYQARLGTYKKFFEGKNNKEIMKIIAEWIFKILSTKNPDESMDDGFSMGDGFKAKLLNTYYPEEFFLYSTQNM